MKPPLLIASLLVAIWPLRAADSAEPKPFVIKTILGETFRGCRVLKATPAALTLAHDSGVTKIPFTLLDDEWKKFFHYDAQKAREFEKQEAKRLELAEAKAKELNRKREKAEGKQMEELAALEREQRAELAKREKEQLEAAAKLAASGGNAPLQPLAPLPGDPKSGGPVTMTTEVVVPPVSALGSPYTPSVSRSQTYVYPNSSGIFVVPGSGGVMISPGSMPGGYCPPVMPRTGVSGQFSVGPMVIRVGH